MTEEIKNFVEEALQEQPDLFLVDVIKKGNDENSKYIIVLDGDNGILIDHCAKVSRELSQHLDETMDENSNPYTIEVTSSGLDHPLLLHRQYVKNIGKNIKVTFLDETTEEGKLTKVTTEEIVIEQLQDKKKKITVEKTIDFKDIKKTFVLVSFK